MLSLTSCLMQNLGTWTNSQPYTNEIIVGLQTTYFTCPFVQYSGNVYVFNNTNQFSNPSLTPNNDSSWTQLGGGGGGGGVSSLTSTGVGNILVTASGTTGDIDQNVISTGLTNYQSVVTYNPGYIIRGDGTSGTANVLYSCRTTTTGTFNIGDWTVFYDPTAVITSFTTATQANIVAFNTGTSTGPDINIGSTGIPTYVNDATNYNYTQGESLICGDGTNGDLSKIYVCINNTNGPFNAADWTIWTASWSVGAAYCQGFAVSGVDNNEIIPFNGTNTALQGLNIVGGNSVQLTIDQLPRKYRVTASIIVNLSAASTASFTVIASNCNIYAQTVDAISTITGTNQVVTVSALIQLNTPSPDTAPLVQLQATNVTGTVDIINQSTFDIVEL